MSHRCIAEFLRSVGHLCQLRLLRLLCLLLRALLPDGFGLVVRADDARVDTKCLAVFVDGGVDVDLVLRLRVKLPCHTDERGEAVNAIGLYRFLRLCKDADQLHIQVHSGQFLRRWRQ